MSLELELKDATLKPDAILKMIAEKFGFVLGVPMHEFNEKSMETSLVMRFLGKRYQTRCALSKADYSGSSAFFYKYLGPVVEEGRVKEINYTAHVIENFVSCKAIMYKFMIMRSQGTPDWFPIED